MKRIRGRVVAVVLAGVGMVTTAPGLAAANPAPRVVGSGTGSLVYILANNVWIARTDGSGAHQVTTDGTADAPYSAPSEAQDGTIAAVRNILQDDGKGHHYHRGYVYLMNRSGQLLATPTAPPQYELVVSGRCPIPVEQEPQGIADMEISPDAQHIAYTPLAYIENLGCSGVISAFQTSVMNEDGSNNVLIRRQGGTTHPFAEPTWLTNSRVVVYLDEFLGQGEYLYDVGTTYAQPWIQQDPTDFSDNAYAQPSVAPGRLATIGQVDSSGSVVDGIRFWSVAGAPPAAATPRCDLSGDGSYNAVSWAPDASALVYEQTGSSSNGIWAVSFDDLDHGVCSGQLARIVPDGRSPFWSRAAYDGVTGPAPGPVGGGSGGSGGTIPAGGGSSQFVSLVPARVLETRTDAGSSTVDGVGFGAGLRPAGSITEVPVAGRAGVPGDASAVVLNVTVTGAQGAGYVTVFPCGSPQPLASSLNYVAGSTVPNGVIAKIGTDGKVCLYTLAATHLIVDVNGYFPG